LTKEVLCEDYGVRWLKERNLWNPDADYIVSTNDLSADDHIADLKGFAKYVDSAISKTINLPNDYTYENFKNIYLDGYKTGYIKGMTTYRAGTMTSVLSAKEETGADEFDEEIILDHVHLPSKANATMVTLKAEGRKWYLTSVYNDNQNRPFAVFVHTNHPEKTTTTNDAVERLINLAYNKKIRDEHITNVIGKIYNESNTAKLTRMVSFLLRHGVLIKNIVSELENVDNVGLGSFLFNLRKYLAQYIKDGTTVGKEEVCDACGAVGTMVYQEGCKSCSSCSSSKC
jgi:ribonucleoside-diphosphate reductase alpha chain